MYKRQAQHRGGHPGQRGGVGEVDADADEEQEEGHGGGGEADAHEDGPDQAAVGDVAARDEGGGPGPADGAPGQHEHDAGGDQAPQRVDPVGDGEREAEHGAAVDRAADLVGGELEQDRLGLGSAGVPGGERDHAVLLVLVGEPGVLQEERPQRRQAERARAALRVVAQPAADGAREHDRGAQVQHRVRAAPRRDVEAVDAVVDQVDGQRDEEHPGAPLHQPQREPVHPVAGERVEQRQRDDDDRARGVEQVRRCELVAQPLEVPGDVPRRAEQFQQQPDEPEPVEQLGERRGRVAAGFSALPVLVAEVRDASPYPRVHPVMMRGGSSRWKRGSPWSLPRCPLGVAADQGEWRR